MDEFRYLGHVVTSDCHDKDVENNSGGEMQLVICSSRNSHLYQRRQKFNCSIRTITQNMDVPFGVIHLGTP